MRSFNKCIVAVFLLVWAGSSFAHPGHSTEGFLSGLSHPIGGLDHILSMLVVGLLAGQKGGKSKLLIPLTCITTMAIATAGGVYDLLIPFTEIGLLLALIAVGIVVALRVELPLSITLPVIAIFSICNGYAHGLEMPLNAKGLEYGIGLMTASSLLIGAGIVLTSVKGRDYVASSFGAIIACAGLGLLVT